VLLRYFRLIRINNWIKNLIIFSSIFFAGEISNVLLLRDSLITFISFSFITSSVYILNDFMDREQDRAHQSKKYRPLASGKISVVHASVMAAVLVVVGLGLIFQLSIDTFYISLFYLAIMIGYCLVFRKIALVDVGIIAIGFVLRLYVGSTVTGFPNSMWIVIMTFLLAVFIALAKRRDDINNPVIEENKTREAFNGYNLVLVDIMITILVPIIIVTYILYCTADNNVARIGENLYLTSVFVFFGFMRYLQLVYVKNQGGDPIKLLYHDTGIQLALILWVSSFGWLLYY
jgi:decaprenyl-phosphate phosphoribosyltransferase